MAGSNGFAGSFRTIGDITCTGAVESTASTLEEIVKEVAAFKISADDAQKRTAAAGTAVPTENAQSRQLGTSRTTVRKILSALARQGIVGGTGRNRTISSS